MAEALFQAVIDDSAGIPMGIVDEARFAYDDLDDRQRKADAFLKKVQSSTRMPIPTRIRALDDDGREIHSWQVPRGITTAVKNSRRR